MSFNTRTATKIEERWTPTTVSTVFALPSLSGKGSSISIGLPLLNLGWTFALSLTPVLPHWQHSRFGINWKTNALVFRRNDRVIPWGDTSMRAELSIAMDPPSPATPANDDRDPPLTSSEGRPSSEPKILGTMDKFALAYADSRAIRLTPHTLSLLTPSKVSLTVTISECPFSMGFFHVTSGGVDEVDAQTRLVKQVGDRILNRSLTTGRIYDTRFLTSPTSQNRDKYLETYASFSVLERHINPSSDRHGETWKSALAALSRRDNDDTNLVSEMTCPDGYEYELDSDFEDEDSPCVESSASVSHSMDDSTPLRDGDSETKTEGSASPFSSFEQDGASDLSSFDSLPEELIKGGGDPLHLCPKTTVDCDPTIVIKFAAHRTWHAFVWYCHTGHLEFSALKSQVAHGVRRLPVAGDGPPPCSPKSMYRLADLMGDKDLKEKTLAAIKARMTKENVLDEMFSVFTSKYPDVRAAQLDAFMQYRKSPEVKNAFLGKISKSSVLPHAEPALEALYDMLVGMNVNTEGATPA